jgi:hypothetical protein
MIDHDEYGTVGGMRIGRRTEVRRENLPQCHFVHHEFLDLGSNPGRSGGNPATNRLSYGTANLIMGT